MAIRRIKNVSEPFVLDNIIASTVNDAMQILAAKALEGRQRVQRKYHPSKTTVFVGGREGADERTVKPGETIRYQFDYLKSIVVDAYKRLRMNSPVDIRATADRFRYKDSHIIIADGQVYEDPLVVPDDATEVTMVNLMPYARKVELRGWGKRGSVTFHAPYHVYELTYSEIKKYSNIVNIKFTWIDMPGFAAGKQATRSDRSRSIRYPALIISLR